MNTRLELALARAVGAVAVEPRAVGSLAAHGVLDDIVVAVVRRHVGLEASVHALVGGHALAALAGTRWGPMPSRDSPRGCSPCGRLRGNVRKLPEHLGMEKKKAKGGKLTRKILVI